MSQVHARSPGIGPVHPDAGKVRTRPSGMLHLDDRAPPRPGPQGDTPPTSHLDHPAPATGELFDTVISHIYGAGLMIQTCCKGASPLLARELNGVTDELDAAIRQLQMAAHHGEVHRLARTTVSAAGNRTQP